ncbi:sirohydrochlorin cobaltochelatase [Cupriavidus sp. OV038]|uniref:sirohydrochlorin chelatase n=1 Tax=Cupriavidus sp. OV038 TaxID=1855313 RepID=UPI0008E9DFA6|nr:MULTISPECIES: CbiX/SirB N-terminal domain-containing protein [unclassified Cupriavidus]SFB81035.1 sirohydrochlorin cobaltochelatase [Cupriavidus sp. OV038]SFO66785.1 sirohydrochlorin cobaltochelatase [Cupriavidus sp. OV096]
MTAVATTGLVLFAHGARDARWREPFDRLQAKLSALLPDTAVRLAFLELMEPSLPVALAELAGVGVAEVTVVPVFFGQGGHIRRDLPALIDQCRAQFPAMRIGCATAVGEAESVLDAIAAYCVGAVATTPSRQSPIGE